MQPLRPNGLTIENGSIINTETGTLDIIITMNILAGAGNSSIVNYGTFTKSASTGTAIISPLVQNHGSIQVWDGTLRFLNLHNETDGTLSGTAHYDFPTASALLNHGTFSPGGDPGSMSGSGTFNSEPDSLLLVALYGLTSGTEYDVFNFWNTASLDGAVVVDLHFAPAIGDSFTVMTAGNISDCSLDDSTTATFEDMAYTFSVTCQDDNKVVLTLTSVTLGTEESAFEKGLTLAPNPASGQTSLKNLTGISLTEVRFFDVSGRRIRSQQLSGTASETLDIAGLPQGTYFLRISSADNSCVKRLIVR